jgi:hypothetical protein
MIADDADRRQPANLDGSDAFSVDELAALRVLDHSMRWRCRRHKTRSIVDRVWRYVASGVVLSGSFWLMDPRDPWWPWDGTMARDGDAAR